MVELCEIIGIGEAIIGVGGLIAGICCSLSTGNPGYNFLVAGSMGPLTDGSARYFTGSNIIKATYNLLKKNDNEPQHF